MKFKVNDYIRLKSNELFPSEVVYQIDYTFSDLFGNDCYLIRIADEGYLSYSIRADELEKIAELY